MAYYVATDGDDSDPGTLEEPFLTIQRGLDEADAAGEAVYVRAGTYNEALTFSYSGISGFPITLAGYPGDAAPVIDGEYTLPTGGASGIDCPCDPYDTFSWDPLVDIGANYIDLIRLEIKRSAGLGIEVEEQNHINIDDCLIHHCRYSTILVDTCTNVLIDGCDIWMSGDYCQCSRSSGVADWGAAVSLQNCSYTTVRNSIVHESWGEGIMAWSDSDNVTLEDNIIYDIYAPSIYINNATYVTVQRNLVYHTNTGFLRGNKPGRGIVVNDEQSGDESHDLVIINNIVVGCHVNFACWIWHSGHGLRDSVIAANTFVNATTNEGEDAAIAIDIAAGDHLDTYIYSNTILQPDDGSIIASVPADGDLYFNYNCWSRTTDTDAQGANDVVDNPDLVDPDRALVAGEVQAIWYKLTSPSPCRGAGVAVTEVTDDYWETTRADPPDVGAHEWTRQGVIVVIV